MDWLMTHVTGACAHVSAEDGAVEGVAGWYRLHQCVVGERRLPVTSLVEIVPLRVFPVKICNVVVPGRPVGAGGSSSDNEYNQIVVDDALRDVHVRNSQINCWLMVVTLETCEFKFTTGYIDNGERNIARVQLPEITPGILFSPPGMVVSLTRLEVYQLTAHTIKVRHGSTLDVEVRGPTVLQADSVCLTLTPSVTRVDFKQTKAPQPAQERGTQKPVIVKQHYCPPTGRYSLTFGLQKRECRGQTSYSVGIRGVGLGSILCCQLLHPERRWRIQGG
ncbi:hypothetical protein OG21DRAFT_1607663 [Imleria badia]|nr:hypothetical protein OG21DRAFT_1607663 [Imleria badia]